MAAAAASQVKQLGQILKEQQEPFILETYLIEKGCFNGNPKQQVSLGCFNGKKKHSRKKRVHKLVRILFHHIASIHKRGKCSETLQAERLSFDSSSTTLNWASFSDDAQEEEEAEESRESCSSSSGNKCFYQHLEFCNPNDEKKQQEINGLALQLHCMEDQNQQFSPDSVLEGFTSSTHEEASSPANSIRNVSYEVILRSAKPQRPNSGVDTSTQQLVFDCIAEMVEMAHGSSRRRKLWCTSERILRSWSWPWRKGKPFRNLELCNPSVIIDEWSDDEQRREIGLEIEDLIFQEMKDEIMVELIGKLV